MSGAGNPVEEQELLDRQLDAGVAAQGLCSHAGHCSRGGRLGSQPGQER
jgi:hypothetical protein